MPSSSTETVNGVAEIATQAETDAGSDDQRIVTPLKLANFTGFNLPIAVVVIQDQKTSGTAGGTATQGDWRTRDLNTEVVDTHGLATISANQVDLAAGSYLVLAWAPGLRINHHQIRLQNIDAGTTLLLGTNSRSLDSDSTGTNAVLMGRINLSSTTTLELQHRPSLTQATFGWGNAISFGTEVYSSICFLRLGDAT